MLSSQEKNVILTIYQDRQTVFRLIDIALLLGETNFSSLSKKLNYYVKTGKLNNPRKGIYTKPGYNPSELACKIYSPSYISLEYVLQKQTPVNKNIIESRMNMRYADYMQKCINHLELMNNKNMLQGLGEIMDKEMKNFVRMKLWKETMALMRFYKKFPIFS